MKQKLYTILCHLSWYWNLPEWLEDRVDDLRYNEFFKEYWGDLD